MAKINAKIQTQFSVWSDKFSASYDLFTAELEAEITSMQLQGMTREAIFAKLESMLTENKGVFSGFNGKIEKYADDLTSSIGQSASNDFDAEELLKWTLDPSAENCDDCIERSGYPAMSYAEWEAEGTPGIADTKCGAYCKCSLDPV
jgi:hypothetical protein